jgi:protein TonB
MIKMFTDVSVVFLQLIAAVAINISLFSLLPVTHNLFSSIAERKAAVSVKPKIIAEYLRPPKKEKPKEPQRRIRQVQSTTSTHPVQSAMDFKFTPDLGVEGTDGVAMAHQDLEAVAFEEGQTDEDAVPAGELQRVPYPARARELGIEGILEALLVIGVDGTVTSVDIRSSPHPSITAEARKTFATWKFTPARNQGVPVSVKKKQVIEFKLNS